MVELLLKILVCIFAVFGLYAFAHALGALCFPNDNIKCTVFVDSEAVAEQIEFYLDEAKNATLFCGRKEVNVLIMEKYATDELLRVVKRKKIPFRILSDAI